MGGTESAAPMRATRRMEVPSSAKAPYMTPRWLTEHLGLYLQSPQVL
jgi:hypothetical protein